jgi:hypothetical protein
MGVVADVARVPFGAVAAAVLVWREYRARRERLVAGAILLVAILYMGNDVVLMALGGIYLLATLSMCYVGRHGGRAPAAGGHAQLAPR